MINEIIASDAASEICKELGLLLASDDCMKITKIIKQAIAKQHKETKEAVAKSISLIPSEIANDGMREVIDKVDAHNSCLNCK